MVCKICHQSVLTKMGNTTILYHHQKRYHPIEHTIILISYKADILVSFIKADKACLQNEMFTFRLDVVLYILKYIS